MFAACDDLGSRAVCFVSCGTTKISRVRIHVIKELRVEMQCSSLL